MRMKMKEEHEYCVELRVKWSELCPNGMPPRIAKFIFENHPEEFLHKFDVKLKEAEKFGIKFDGPMRTSLLESVINERLSGFWSHVENMDVHKQLQKVVKFMESLEDENDS